MRDMALLIVWLLGLSGLIGTVIAAVMRFVRKDSMDYDTRFVWKTGRKWDPRNDFKHRP